METKQGYNTYWIYKKAKMIKKKNLGETALPKVKKFLLTQQFSTSTI